VTSQGALLPPTYYRWPGGRDVACTVGNEETWFRPKEVRALKRETPKAAPTPLKKTSIRAGKSASENAYLYRGLFSRVRVVPALRAPEGIAVEGST
jgi:hypothetical protein